MGKVTRVMKPSKMNEVVLKSYEDVITKRMKAGFDVTNAPIRPWLIIDGECAPVDRSAKNI